MEINPLDLLQKTTTTKSPKKNNNKHTHTHKKTQKHTHHELTYYTNKKIPKEKQQ